MENLCRQTGTNRRYNHSARIFQWPEQHQLYAGTKTKSDSGLFADVQGDLPHDRPADKGDHQKTCSQYGIRPV